MVRRHQRSCPNFARGIRTGNGLTMSLGTDACDVTLPACSCCNSPSLAVQIAGDHKVLLADTSADCQQVLRHLGEIHPTLPLWRQQRPALHINAAQPLFDAADAAAKGPVVVKYGLEFFMILLSCASVMLLSISHFLAPVCTMPPCSNQLLLTELKSCCCHHDETRICITSNCILLCLDMMWHSLAGLSEYVVCHMAKAAICFHHVLYRLDVKASQLKTTAGTMVVLLACLAPVDTDSGPCPFANCF